MEEKDNSEYPIGTTALVEDIRTVSSFEEAIQIVKPNGLYQIISMILLVISYTSTGAVLAYGFSFLERDPIIHCYTSDTEFHKCNRQEACGPNKFTRVQFNFIEEGYSWNNDFHLKCEDNWIIGMFGTSYFIGTLLSTIIVGALTDLFGRANIIKISMALRTFIVIIPLIYPNANVVIGVLVGLGLLNALHSTVPYILIGESISGVNMNLYLTLMFMFESFSGIITTIFFTIKQNWKYFLIFNAAYSGIFILFCWFIYESPQFLYATHKYSQARNILKKIAKINTGKEITIQFSEEEAKANIDDKESQIAQPKKKVLGFVDLCRSFTKEIILLPMIWLLDAFAFFAINFMVKYLEGNLTVLNVILFASEMISVFISNILLRWINKIALMGLCFILSGLAFFVFYLFDLSKNQISLYTVTFFAKFGSSIVLNISSIYTNEAFPSEIRGRAIAICSFVGKFGSIFAPMITEVTSIIPIISGSICFLASVVSFLLPNKTQNKLNDDDNNKETKSPHSRSRLNSNSKSHSNSPHQSIENEKEKKEELN